MSEPNRLHKSPWKTLDRKPVYENKWIRVEEHQVLNPAGQPGIYGQVHFKNVALGIVPVDHEMNTWLVGQWRYPLEAWSWEIPEGGSAGETDLIAGAQRELREETGLLAEKWKLLQKVHLSNSVSDEVGYVYLAQGLTAVPTAREETEADMVVWKLPLAEAWQLVRKGTVTDSLSIIGITQACLQLGITTS